MLGGGPSGAGNPVAGANPTGIGNTINYVGNLVYGYSGMLAVSSGNDATLLKFTTGSELIKCKVEFTFDYDQLVNGKFFGVEIKLDGQTVLKPRAEQRISGSGHGTNLISKIDLVIAPHTKVEIIGQTDDDNTECGCVLTGRMV
tara:strand:- start:387 stop:818 length:432 start_codon:yes stop_codon:yes gene_type:complete